jgi:hypothetical protein
MIDPDSDKLWYQPTLDVFLNQWFSKYDEARQALDSGNGFLLPYKNHFFVCEADVIKALGLEPDDPDWEKIGRDAAMPRDREALQRLRKKRVEAVAKASPDAGDPH